MLPPLLQTALSAAIDGAIIEVFAEKATDKAFLQKLTHSKLKREFADQIETHYLTSIELFF